MAFLQPRDWVHATVVERIIQCFSTADCVVAPETPYNYYGARGVVDVARYRPGLLSGCRADLVEVETRLHDVNTVIRKVRERALLFPEYLRSFKELDIASVTAWLALLATQENSETILEYRWTLASMFGSGIREPHPDGVRYGLCFVDPLAFKGVRALAMQRHIDAGTLEATLADLCPYDDKFAFERAWLRVRRGQRELEPAA